MSFAPAVFREKGHYMRERRQTAGLVAGVIICFLLILCASPCAAAAHGQDLRTVRVGFFAFDGYHVTSADGTRSGYGYDLLQHMAGYTDWRYEYVGYGKGWGEMQRMLEKGEIDLLTSAQNTAERRKRFDFSDRPVGTSAAILTVKAGDKKFALKDYANWNGMRVGMIRRNSRNDDLDGFAAQKGFSYSTVYFDDTASMVKALKTGGEIDAALTSNLRSIDDEWVLAQFASSPFYIMTRKGNRRLMAEVNEALEQLSNDEPGLLTMLMNKYYTPDCGEEIAFTVEERAYIEAMRGVKLTALINPDRAPFSSFENGRPVGIISDIARMITERSGLNIQLIETGSREEYRRLAKSGKTDIRFDARYDYAEAEAMGCRLTAPYLDASVTRLYKRGGDGFSSAALLKDSDISAKYGEYLSDKRRDAVYYDTAAGAVGAVLSGKQGVTYLYRRSAELAAQNDETNRLMIEDLYGYNTSFAVAVSGRQSHLLFSILNKSVLSIKNEEIKAIDQRHASYTEKPFSFVGFIYGSPLVVSGIVAALFIMLGLAAFSVLLSRKRRREHAQLAEEKRRSGLLADALAAAERADAAKSQFLSRVSHEMRTPLNAIIGFITLARGAEPRQLEGYLTNTEVASKQLLLVINDVLDMSSIESGKMKIAHAPFDFRHMIHSVTSLYLAQCHQKGLQYETKLLTPVDDWFIGDQLRVNQILMNLLSNAVKFTTEGHVWLKISQRDAPGNKAFIRIEVSDTGCGITKEMQARLFKPFEQESAAVAQKYGGSGLGLSIVKSLVSMMDGAICVESVSGKGTAFVVDLPFIKGEALLDAQMPAGIEKLRVLAVDDEPAEREYISVVLGRIGVRYACVGDGKAAIAELERCAGEDAPYNICLIDWKIPNMDGIEITKRIREKFNRNVIIIVVSAYEHNQAGESAVEAGANMFIPKPLFQSSLFDLFMTLTGGGVAGKKAAPAAPRDFSGKRVLLAEDNAMNRMVAEGLLGKFGLECDSVMDGRMAVDKFLASAPGYYDAILMDIQMPHMNGYEAARAIRCSAHPEAKTIQIIALTADAFNEDITKTLSNGMNGHVAKPIEPDVLAEALDTAFKAEQTRRQG